MSDEHTWRGRVIARLSRIHDEEDRGARAALRRAARGAAEDEAAAYPFVMPYIDHDWQLPRALLTASLYGLHPGDGPTSGARSIGAALLRVAPAGSDSRQAVERRFTALLRLSESELGPLLRQAVSLAKSKDVAINYANLLRDLDAWDHPARHVQRRWARDFWRAPSATNHANDNA